MNHQGLTGCALKVPVTHGKFRDDLVIFYQSQIIVLSFITPSAIAHLVQTGNRGSELAVSCAVAASDVDKDAIEEEGVVFGDVEVFGSVLNGEKHRWLRLLDSPLQCICNQRQSVAEAVNRTNQNNGYISKNKPVKSVNTVFVFLAEVRIFSLSLCLSV